MKTDIAEQCSQHCQLRWKDFINLEAFFRPVIDLSHYAGEESNQDDLIVISKMTCFPIRR